jgi:hypothetical protein
MFDVERTAQEIDAVFRDLARLTLEQLLGAPTALKTADIFQAHPMVLNEALPAALRERAQSAENEDERNRLERLLFTCIDLAVHEQTSSLWDMLDFYMARSFMHVSGEKIPALDVVPWLQAQTDFHKREEMQKENIIYFKGIVNPVLKGIFDLTTQTIKETFGYAGYAQYCEAKKDVSFSDFATEYESYLTFTADTYRQMIEPWVEEEIGRPLNNLSRFHALYLLRIKRFDEHFPTDRLKPLVFNTFRHLGFDFETRQDVVVRANQESSRNGSGVCLGVDIPGEVHVVMKPVGGLIDVETLFHECGHAYFLANFDPALPVEYRRLYRSPALDESFAFLFMELVGNPAWLTDTAGLPASLADELATLSGIKHLCLIRRYIGKFLAEKEFYETGVVQNSEPYCRRLNEATLFVYEPEGYLVDMESDFYSLDYLRGWAGAATLKNRLLRDYGETWFTKSEAGEFLARIAAAGRSKSLDRAIEDACGERPSLPNFAAL